MILITTFKRAVCAALVAGILAVNAHAVDPTRQEPIYMAGTPFMVSVSTSQWTKVTPGTTFDRRGGAMVVVPAANTAAVRGIYWAAGGTPTVSTTTYSVELPKGATYEIKVGQLLDLYLVSLHTAAESVGVQEIRYGK